MSACVSQYDIVHRRCKQIAIIYQNFLYERLDLGIDGRSRSSSHRL